MALSHRLCLLLHGTLVVVATVAMAIMVIMAAAATATQEVALPRWGDVMPLCDAEKAKVSMANNAGTGTTAEQLTCTWAVLWGK